MKSPVTKLLYVFFLRRIPVIFLLFGWQSIAAFAAPVVFWASDPVRPDETALVIGASLDNTTEVRIERMRDDPNAESLTGNELRSVTPSLTSKDSLFFQIPADFKIGVYRYNISTTQGSTSGLLNRPALFWAQGNAGAAVTPGSELRLFGRSIVFGPGALVAFNNVAEGRRLVAPVTTGSLWTASVVVPSDAIPGQYQVSVWNGCGGTEAWSDWVPIEIGAPAPVVRRTLSVKDFGAKGDGTTDDADAIAAGLAAVANGGGILFFPPGRFLARREITVPAGVTLRGADRDLASVLWPDFETPPESLIAGAHDFSIENLSFYASNHLNVISGGFEHGEAAEGNIHIRNIRIRASAYRGHMAPDEILRRMSHLTTDARGQNGGDAIRLRGKKLEVSDSDIYASGSSLFILDSQDVSISRNILYNGRNGWYSFSGSRRVRIEDNDFVGSDLSATGGGINTLFTSATSTENYWLFHNTFRLMHGWDREAMTSDGGGGSYYGAIAAADGRKLKLQGALEAQAGSVVGQGVFVLEGRGAGEFAQIQGFDGNSIVLDRQWDVLPDTSSIVTITAMVQNYLVIDNTFSDAGVAVQFYGTSVNQVVAGNISSRTGGFLNQGLWYHHPQPSWYIQYHDNQILDGTVYRGGLDTSVLSGEAIIGALGVPNPASHSPLVLGVVMRRNKLAQNARIAVRGCEAAAPLVRGVLVEKNSILNDQDPIVGVSRNCEAFVRDNFKHF